MKRAARDGLRPRARSPRSLRGRGGHRRSGGRSRRPSTGRAPRTVDKPWGWELRWAQTKDYVGKVLHIRAGEALSLQYHRVKEETLLLWRGRMTLEHFAEGQPPRTTEMAAGDVFHVAPGLRHRMIAIEDCDVFEVSTPHLDDVVRLEDRYGRAGG